MCVRQSFIARQLTLLHRLIGGQARRLNGVSKTAFIGSAFVVSCATALSAAPVHVAVVVIPLMNSTLPPAMPMSEAQLSREPAVALVEWNLVHRLLYEQAKTIEFGSAAGEMKLGKLASAELMAVVERTPENIASSLVVFDAETGVRLIDTPLSQGDPAVAANTIVTSVRAAVGKRTLPVSRRHTVCLKSVRNADLPHDADSFCDDVGRQLQRQLTNAADVVVLERDRLDSVMAERALPTATLADRELLASVIVIDLQLSTAPLGDVTAKALLSDPAGHAVASPSATAHGRDVDSLAEKLAIGVIDALHTGANVPGGKQEQEADRFHREAELCWAHADLAGALRASEAAYALAPNAPGIGAALARARIESGVELAYTFTPGAADDPVLWPKDDLTAADLDASLKLTLSGCELLPAAANDASAVIDRAAAEHVLRRYLTMAGAQAYGPPKFQGFKKIDLSPPQRDAFDALRRSFRRYRMDAQQPLAVADVHDRDGFDAYSAFVYELLGDSQYCFSVTPGEWTADVKRVIPPWVELSRRFDTPARGLQPSRHPLNPTGHSREDPTGRLLYTLCDGWLHGGTNWAGVSFDFGQRPMQRLDFNVAELDELNATFVVLASCVDPAFKLSGNDGQTWISEERWKRSRGNQPAPPQIYPERLLAADTTPAAPAPQANETVAAPGLFWKESRTLLDVLHAGSGIERIFDPVVVGSAVYTIGINQDAEHPAAQLLKFDVDRGPAAVVSQHADDWYRAFAMSDRIDLQSRLTMGWPGTSGAVADGTYVFVSWGQRIVLFPLAGGPARCITPKELGHPDVPIQAATLVDGSLYVALGTPDSEAFVLAMNLKTGAVDTLASSRRKEHLSPFDDSAPFGTSTLIADAPRRRIVFHASSTLWEAGRSGVWALDVKDRTFHQLCASPGKIDSPQPASVSQSPFSPTQWSFDGGGGYLILDLATNKVLNYPTVQIRLTAQSSEVRNLWEGEPAALLGDWICRPIRLDGERKWKPWWGRVNVHTGDMQLFPWVRPIELPIGCWPLYLSKVDDQRFLVGDESGLWIMTPPDDATASADPPKPKPTIVPLPPPASGGQLPWRSGRTLYDITQADTGEHLDFIYEPHLHGEFVYAVGLGHHGGTDGQRFIKLIQFSTADGSRKELGSAAINGRWMIDMPAKQRAHYSFGLMLGSTVDDHHFYTATMSGLFDFPLDGSPGKELYIGGRWGRSSSVCTMGGMLFATNIFGGSIVRYDPASGKSETILGKIDDVQPTFGASRSPQREIKLLGGDLPRHRIFYIAYGPAIDPTQDGLWSLDVDTKQSKLLVPLFLHYEFGRQTWAGRSVRLEWNGVAEDGTLLVATTRGLFSFDPQTDTAKPLHQNCAGLDVLAATAEPSTAPASKNPLLAGSINGLHWPYAVGDGWLWGGLGFSRASLDGKRWQTFQSPREDDGNLTPDTLQLLDRGRRLLVADSGGCWLLDVK